MPSAAICTWAPATTIPVTARIYTDLGLFTCNDEIGADVSDLFNHLTGYSAKKAYRKLLVAPHTIRTGFERLIRREMERHKAHGDGHLIFKMNALEDPGMIRLLYEASQAGVKIDLIIRGVCSLAARCSWQSVKPSPSAASSADFWNTAASIISPTAAKSRSMLAAPI